MSVNTITPVALPIDTSEFDFVVDLLRQAGKKAVEMREDVEISTKSSPEDLVTCADKALSEMIVEGLTKRFPKDLVLSEEAPWVEMSKKDHKARVRRWFIDPIDGTKHYVKNDGRYSVMVGLEEKGKLVFGAFYLPFYDILYYGGPEIGAFKMTNGRSEAIKDFAPLEPGAKIRALVSKNDLAANPWVANIPNIEIVTASSIGLDIHELFCGEADVFVHIRPTLKVWDTAAPGAVALGARMDVGTELADFIPFDIKSPKHEPCIVMGRPGALRWWRKAWTFCNEE